MKAKKVLLYIGVLLIIIQALSYFGMSRMRVGLFPDAGDLPYPQIINRSGLNFKMALFAVGAGIDRFNLGFEDLTFAKEDYRVMSATQMASAMIRESLSFSNGIGLVVYDTILTISYCFPGIAGAALVFISRRTKDTK